MRLVQIVYAAALAPPNLSEIAGECVYLWHQGDSIGHRTTSAIVPPRVVERILELLRAQWGSDADYRVVVLPVEATYPQTPTSVPAPRGTRLSREEILADLIPAVEVTRTYLALVVLSTIVACVGLLRGDVAIIIGAMVLAPLLSPNVGLALASSLADVGLAKKALAANTIGFGAAAIMSFAVGLVVEPSASLPELAARTHVDYVDLILALAAGVAATLTVTTGLGGALVGVMVAVALLPPTASMSMLAGAGHWREASDVAVLLGANLVCVNLAGVFTFAAQGVRPSMWWEQDRARRARLAAGIVWLLLLAGLLALLRFGWR